jgi:Trk K+ transport system NAD-binding subunit
LRKMRGLVPATDQVFKLDAPRGQRTLIEVVVASSCPIVGKTINDGRFRHVYNAIVITVIPMTARGEKIDDINVTAGDKLLVEPDPTFTARYRNN